MKWPIALHSWVALQLSRTMLHHLVAGASNFGSRLSAEFDPKQKYEPPKSGREFLADSGLTPKSADLVGAGRAGQMHRQVGTRSLHANEDAHRTIFPISHVAWRRIGRSQRICVRCFSRHADFIPLVVADSGSILATKHVNGVGRALRHKRQDVVFRSGTNRHRAAGRIAGSRLRFTVAYCGDACRENDRKTFHAFDSQ